MGHAADDIGGGQAPDQAKAPTGPGPATATGQVIRKDTKSVLTGVTLAITDPQPSRVSELRVGFSQS
jgi:hypothetical protein